MQNLRTYDKPRFFLPDDLIRRALEFLWPNASLTAAEFAEDIRFYAQWQAIVPAIFLECAVFDTTKCYYVPSPLRKDHPYWPRKVLVLKPRNVWSDALRAFGMMICRERIREIKTYRRCALRWIANCEQNVDLWYWFDLHQKLLNRLTIQHFRPRSHQGFVQEAFRQLSLCKRAFGV